MKTKTKTNKNRFKRTKCNNKHNNRRRNTNRVRKYNKHQTKTKSRRQFGGEFQPFVTADDNLINRRKGIDVKVEVDSSTGKPSWWLIGGNKWFVDLTFDELRTGGKEKRYVPFIGKLLEKYPYFNNFTNPSSDRDSSKGIKLSHEQFCNMFINNPVPELDYPMLKKRFAEREYKCPESASSSVPIPASTAAALRPATVTAKTSFMPSDVAVKEIQEMGFDNKNAIIEALIKTEGDIGAAIGFLFEQPPSSSAAMGGVVVTTPPITEPIKTKYIKQLNEIKNLKLKDVTLKTIAQALDSTGGNANMAVAILSPDAASSASAFASSAQLLSLEKIKKAYDATPVDLKNPNMFVENYVRTNGIRLLPNPSYRLDGRNLKAFPGFDGWQVVQTVGDGNCLTHAFLQCLSPIYGKIKDEGYTVKYNVALEFRKNFCQTSQLARDKKLYEAGKFTGYLTDLEILDYSRLFNVITVVFEQVTANPDMTNPIIAHNFLRESSKTTDTVIFIHGDGRHYSSVMPSTGFTMTLADAKKIPGLQRSLS